jgi:HSP20 family protein
MTNLTRWDPFPSMRDLMDRLNANFEQASLLRGQPTMTDFPVEISETESAIQIKASLPGVAPEDIDISVQANSLTIKAESKEEAEEKGKNFLRREMSYGAMQRSFTLPTGVNPDKAEAVFRNGVLRLTLPKAEPSSTKQIKVS